MKKIVLFSIILISVVSCSNNNVKKDAERMAELFCKQNKIVSQAQDLHDSTVLKQLQQIEEEANKINKELESKYANDTKSMELFAKTYQERILKCK
jgi:biopolymer transport protein ExbB/TolQ